MLDKDWLDRVLIAYNVYKETTTDTQKVKEFIQWLYKQYGYIVRENLKD